MTRSIFDPTGGETERSGSTHLGPDARNISHMPSDVTDGDAREAGSAAADQAPDALATDSAEAARQLERMTQAQGAEETPPA